MKPSTVPLESTLDYSTGTYSYRAYQNGCDCKYLKEVTIKRDGNVIIREDKITDAAEMEFIDNLIYLHKNHRNKRKKSVIEDICLSIIMENMK